MTGNENNLFDKLPGFGETLARIVRVPPPGDEAKSAEFSHRVSDESNGVVYRLVSDHRLNPAEVRSALGKAFRRTELWPDDDAEIEIRV